MKKLSVIVNGISNNERFINNLFTEIGNEITTKIDNNEISFLDVDEKNKFVLYKALAKNIVSEFCKKVLVRIINKNCDCFSKSDKYEIWKLSMKYLLNDEFEENSDYLSRVDFVEQKLNEYFITSKSVSVEGFVNFRLKELETELEDVVDDCVQEYMLELEYIEFINMIKYYVSIQGPKYLSVEVLYGNDIKIYGDGKDITKECSDDFKTEINYNEKNVEDYILNSLITISPKRIFIKEKDRKLSEEIKKTLLGVFGDKLKITTE